MKRKIDGKKRAKAPVERKQNKPAAKPARQAAPVEETKTSKKDIVIALLRRENGATLAELMTTTGWQAHSVRGFISTLRKKRGLDVEATKREHDRVYKMR